MDNHNNYNKLYIIHNNIYFIIKIQMYEFTYMNSMYNLLWLNSTQKEYNYF